MLNIEEITRVVVAVIKTLEAMPSVQPPCAPESVKPQVNNTQTGVPDMIQAKVVGSVWSSHKVDELTGHKLMMVKEMDEPSHTFVAIDRIGAGLNDSVLVSFCKKYPIDAEIVAIIDQTRP